MNKHQKFVSVGVSEPARQLEIQDHLNCSLEKRKMEDCCFSLWKHCYFSHLSLAQWKSWTCYWLVRNWRLEMEVQEPTIRLVIVCYTVMFFIMMKQFICSCHRKVAVQHVKSDRFNLLSCYRMSFGEIGESPALFVNTWKYLCLYCICRSICRYEWNGCPIILVCGRSRLFIYACFYLNPIFLLWLSEQIIF